jgi:hydroxylamine reductase (hybrid-cluster protein)
MTMYCAQCEQTSKGVACADVTPAPCGKTPTLAALQDLLIYGLKGVGQYAERSRAAGTRNPTIKAFVRDARAAKCLTPFRRFRRSYARFRALRSHAGAR